MPHRKQIRRWRVVAVACMTIAAMALLVTILLWRAHRTDLTARRLCQVIAQIVSDQDARLNGIAYYKAHPAELRRAHADNRDVLQRLNCTATPPVKSDGAGNHK